MFGGGNFSEGIRLLAETAYTSTGKPWCTARGCVVLADELCPYPTI